MSDTTPPNWPIYNIKLNHDQISGIVKRIYPDSRLISTKELEKRKSFNNRIYFLSIDGAVEEEEQHQDAVLKIVGRFFDDLKVQNEVASLLLLAKWCPEIPVPRVLAWSEDGQTITAIRQGVFVVLSNPVIDDSSLPTSHYPWVMLSECPGRILEEEDLSGEHSEAIADQLADIVKSWRCNIPPREVLGNVKLQVAGYTSSNDLHGLESIVEGFLLIETQPKQPLTSLKDYYNHLFSDQIHKVETVDVFANLRPRLLDKLRTFRQDTFPHLPCFTQLPPPLSSSSGNPDPPVPANPVSVFTHQDFAPRNILITPSTTPSSPPLITGLLDFEFAGFFAPEEEFLNSLVRQDSDWPAPFMQKLLNKLVERGVWVPPGAITPTSAAESDQYGTDDFEMLSQVIKLIENIAPWQLQAGHITAQELEDELEKAAQTVDGLIQILERSVGSFKT